MSYLGEECHLNAEINNIIKGHYIGMKMRDICPLTMSVTSSWALSLKTWQLTTLFSAFRCQILWDVQVRQCYYLQDTIPFHKLSSH